MNLKQLRIKQNIKQDYLAFKLNLSQGAISLFECGKRQYKIEQLPTLIKILNCSYEELIFAIIESKGVKNEKK